MKHILLIIATLLCIQNLSASNNVEVKAEISHVDCSLASSTLYMNIFIRKAENVTQDIFLEDQNYRFNFNAQSLLEGSFFIDSEGDLLSGFNVNPNGTAYIFGDHHITGSTQHILSYNIEYQGGNNGLRLDEEWIRVGTIGATLLTNIECITSDILTASSFPSTTLLYTYSDSTTAETIIDRSPNVYNLGICIDSHCDHCTENLILIASQDDYVSGHILEHKVSDFIAAKNVIDKQANIIYNVKNEGELQSGFEVKKDAVFEVKLEGCQN